MTPLRQRMVEDLKIRQYAPATRANYIRCVAQFAKHFGRPIERLTLEHVREFLVPPLATASPTPDTRSSKPPWLAWNSCAAGDRSSRGRRRVPSRSRDA